MRKYLATVRLATKDDAKSISSVLRESFDKYKPLYTRDAFSATTPTPVEVIARFKEGPTWVAVRERKVVGTVSALPVDRSLYVRSMAVVLSARGLGIGPSLLWQVETYALEGNFRSLFLSTTPFLHDAIRLYERHGFVRTSEGPRDLFGTPLFTMRKRLQ